VFREGPVQFVYTPRAGKMARVPVSVGRRSDAYAEITEGLKPGALVLVREPRPAEVLREDWDESELRLVGLELGEDGQPRRIGAPGGPGMPGRPPARGAGPRRGAGDGADARAGESGLEGTRGAGAAPEGAEEVASAADEDAEGPAPEQEKAGADPATERSEPGTD
jgi:hypothetical protein